MLTARSSDDIREVSKSYKEAKLALDVGKIFFDEKKVIAYSTLGIGRIDLSVADSAL